jgi:hypothetical protein
MRQTSTDLRSRGRATAVTKATYGTTLGAGG